MPENIHKGTELNNVKETWNQNEKNDHPNKKAPPSTDEDLKRTIEEESSEYDKANKEERLLSGDRASVKDDDALQE